MKYETSENSKEFRKFQQAATIYAGLPLIIAEYLQIKCQTQSTKKSIPRKNIMNEQEGKCGST